MAHHVSFTCSLVLFLIISNYQLVNCYYYEEPKPMYLTAPVGGYIIFNCYVDFPQIIEIPYLVKWNKDGETVYSRTEGKTTAVDPYIGRIDEPAFADGTVYGKASINLTAIRDTDAGWYECQVIFPNRTPSSRSNGTWFHLTVNGGNLLAVPPINQTTLEGEPAKFICLTKDPELRVNWYKDGIPLRDYQDLYRRSQVTRENTLIINPTDMGDIGEYECELINKDLERQTAKAFLNVTYKAKVIYAPPEIHLLYGRPALIDCHFRANPPLTNLRWEKDGFLYDPYNIQGVFYRKNGSLYFTKVDDTHNGRYTCTPYNVLGTQGPSPPIQVTVQRPPVFVITPHNLYLKKLGETIEMPCDARDGDNGHHKPIIIWYKKDGSSLPTGRYSIKDGNLTITNIQQQDHGFYQCSASNRAATITAETELMVEDIPRNAPYNLTAIPMVNSVHLTWLSGRNQRHTFNVWYRKLTSTDWRSHQVEPPQTLQATVDGLEPGTDYEFMVLSKDKNDDGVFSKTIRVRTRNAIDDEVVPYRSVANRPPLGFPRNVTIIPTESGFLVTWEPPEYGRENLKKYAIRWYQGPDDYLFGTAETYNTSYLLSDLSDGNEYNIQVIAISNDDQQAISEKITMAIPGYKKIRAVSTGIITGLAFLIAAFIGLYYAKKKWCQPYKKQQNLKPEK